MTFRTMPLRRRLWIAVLAAVLLAAPLVALAAYTYPKAKVVAAGHTFLVDVADTPDTQSLGLGGRKHLGPSDGMLFVYTDKGRHAFWMKGMVIAIDMIWLDNRRIVHIQRKVPPPAPGSSESQLPTYSPDQAANFVLEIASGRAQELGLKEGDLVSYDFTPAGK